MNKVVFLDAGPLGLASHPRFSKAIVAWIETLLLADDRIAIPEIADYEIRRELLRAKKTQGVRRLDYLKSQMIYVPLTTQGVPTSHHHALDADVILAAQALTYSATNEDDIVVATDNVAHLSRFVPAQSWEAIT